MKTLNFLTCLAVILNFGWILKSLRIPFYAFGVGHTLFYIHRYIELHKLGYKIPMVKLGLFAVTNITTILTMFSLFL